LEVRQTKGICSSVLYTLVLSTITVCGRKHFCVHFKRIYERSNFYI
jgi:hypothetical protein